MGLLFVVLVLHFAFFGLQCGNEAFQFIFLRHAIGKGVF